MFNPVKLLSKEDIKMLEDAGITVLDKELNSKEEIELYKEITTKLNTNEAERIMDLLSDS